MKFASDARNILIILALAAAVAFFQAGQTAASVIGSAAVFAFIAAFVWVGVALYREHRMSLESLGVKRRAIAYVAGGVGVLVLCATSKLWSTPLGSIAWLVLLAGAGYAIYAVWRSAKEY